MKSIFDNALLRSQVLQVIDKTRAIDPVEVENRIVTAIERQRTGTPLDACRIPDTGRAKNAAGELEEREFGTIAVAINDCGVGNQPDRFAVAVGKPLDEHARLEVAGWPESLDHIDDQAARGITTAFTPVAAECIVDHESLGGTEQYGSRRKRQCVFAETFQHHDFLLRMR
ncbi:MAG: hypothetical protein KGY48_10920 [Wenzhouxiangellaceae bacterium]|nr:hypothetical protein [Wenzhouxiangellaceae bacterium]MBS3824483.1 hypothetical protein [Wenzhouxiangellaceae bacterium]